MVFSGPLKVCVLIRFNIRVGKFLKNKKPASKCFRPWGWVQPLAYFTVLQKCKSHSWLWAMDWVGLGHSLLTLLQYVGDVFFPQYWGLASDRERLSPVSLARGSGGLSALFWRSYLSVIPVSSLPRPLLLPLVSMCGTAGSLAPQWAVPESPLFSVAPRHPRCAIPVSAESQVDWNQPLAAHESRHVGVQRPPEEKLWVGLFLLVLSVTA